PSRSIVPVRPGPFVSLRVRPGGRGQPGRACRRRIAGRSGRARRRAPRPPDGLLCPRGSHRAGRTGAAGARSRDSTGSAWVEMWARLWRIDTLFETGELRSVHGELADLGLCLERLRAPLGRWHSLECAATLALATGRFSEAVRLSREAFTLISGMGHPVAFGGYAVILCQAGLHIGFDRSGATELFGHIPAHLKPDVVDTTRGVATVFPALSFA